MADNTKKRVTAVDIVKGLIRWEDNKAHCAIDPLSGCTYSVAREKFDSGNYARHFRTLHPEAAEKNHLCKPDTPAKKPKPIPKVPVAINKPTFVEGCMKLVTVHHLPLSCFEWEGMKILMDPVAKALDVTMNRNNIKVHMEVAAAKIKEMIKAEMKGKLISIKIDSASRHHRHVLGVNVQYALDDKVTIRTLAMMEVKKSQTAKFLTKTVLDILSGYGVSIEQLYTVATDNGANMLAAIKELKTTISKLLLEQDPSANLSEDGDDDANAECDEEVAELLEGLIEEFKNYIGMTRCAVHTLQLAVGDVVRKNDENIAKITKLVKESRKTKYSLYFDHKKASKAPLWCVTRWGGRYEMIRSIVSQEQFYRELATEHKELEFSEDDWIYMKHFAAAFKPVFELTKKMQTKHCSLSDFYIHWLQATCTIEKDSGNPFRAPLIQALNNRLKLLMESMAFKAAVYLDRRLNFLGSTVFASLEDKEAVVNFIINTYNRIVNLSASATEGPSTSSSISPAVTQSSEDCSDDFEDYITRMIGGSSASPAGVSSLHIQLRQLEMEPRQPHNYDVWNHWLARKQTHPELYTVAMVVLAAPSNQVSVERAFSALALVLSDLRTGLAEKTLEEILLIKLNRDIFQKLIPLLYDWGTASLT